MSTSPLSALVLVAHADDETLGCGGTIPKLVRAGWRVDIVILADGIVRVRGGSDQDNRGDAMRACDRLGAPPPRFMGFPDQKFDTVALSDMASAVGSLGLAPDLILTHADSDLNLDHRITCEVAKVVGRPKSRPVAILGCEIPGGTFWNASHFRANYFVDIADTLETKKEAFALYTNEVAPFPHPCSCEGIAVLAQYHGMQCGLARAEAFTVIRGYEGRLP